MEEENLQNQIYIAIDKKTLLIVFDTLSFMSKNYRVTGVIDHAAWIISEQNLHDTIEILKSYLHSKETVVLISMTLQQWNSYVRLVDYAGFSAPQQKNRAILEDLYDSYSDLENKDVFSKKVYSEMSNYEKVQRAIQSHKDTLDKLADL